MNEMKKLLSIIIFTLLLGFNEASELPVIPLPKQVDYNNSKFSLEVSDLNLKLFVKDTNHVMHGVSELQVEFKRWHNINVNLSENQNAQIILGLKGSNRNFDKLCKEANFNLDKELGEQGYQLQVSNDRIIIAANKKQGLYYGIQTLKQLLRGFLNQTELPGIIVRDYPDLKYRFLMDDISRGPIPTMEFMKYQIRRIAELKMNGMTHYVEHVVKTKKHGAFAPPDGSITIDEWKELSSYAKKYFVTLVGSFQSFGHFQSIQNHPKYAPLAESGSLISPVLPESIEFLRDIYEEMIPAFDSPWFAINCDETFDLGRGYSKQLVEEIGYAQVYKKHVLKLNDIVKDHGKRSWIWGDIMLQYPELIEQLPKDMIVGTWTYDSRDSFDEYIIPFKEKGFDVLVVPGVLNSSRTMPDWNQTVINIHNFIRDGVKHNAMGFLNTVWDDGGFAFFSLDWYGVVYSADQGWYSREMNLESFHNRFNRSINVDNNNNFTDALYKLLEIGELSPTGRMSQKVVWLKVLPEKYESVNISIDEWDQVLNLCDQAEELLNNSSPQLYTEQKEYFQFIVELYRSMAKKRFNMIDAADIYKEASILQDAAPENSRELLLKALELISNTKQMQIKLAAQYKSLWLKENHTYSLMKIVDQFNKEIDDLYEIEKLVFDALKLFDSGLYIPNPNEVRLEINQVSGKYFREWMMINPLPNDDNLPSSQIDYLVEMGGEKNAKPKVTQEFFYDSQKYRWRRVETEYFDVVNLAELFPDKNENVVMYAHATINSPIAQVVKASVGSADGIKVFINSNIVYEFDLTRTLSPDEDSFEINLNEGVNHLLIKITQLSGEWGFTFRLIESKVQNSKNRYYIR